MLHAVELLRFLTKIKNFIKKPTLNLPGNPVASGQLSMLDHLILVLLMVENALNLCTLLDR